ncbi:MAG: GNAT family N-acetyltransferase [Rickettsiales bacterium]|nr:GNAT family N-acetyltransferase [Rickettsiales bacterium]|tara:strand:+ start:665 stop:1855 length:1191 start_codon:yes stop_codon:yes gene_type:complete
MKMTEDAFPVSIATTIHEIDAEQWDALGDANNPFLEHRFFAALEDSGSVGKKSGWLPAYLLLHDSQGSLHGAVPSWLRSNSYGEYIFDWAWASACQRAGIRYYPKITAAVPFTPVSGPRLLVHPDSDPARVRSALGQAALELAGQAGCSSVHLLFCKEEEARGLESLGYLVRRTFQYHWTNRGWKDFASFLADLKRKRRGEILRERRRLQDAGVEIVLLRGAELDSSHWQAIHGFYRDTIAKMGAIPYLSPQFFLEQAPARLADRSVAVLARRGGNWIAGSLSFARGAHLYGRYWGCSESVPGLHFELCYQRLIEYAIDSGMSRFEAGAQGDHKLHRGLLPSSTWSAHYLAHQGLREAAQDHLHHEARLLEEKMEWLLERGPYKDNFTQQQAPKRS